jgi:ribosomal protein S18 acetylase RimI-like enzyme
MEITSPLGSLRVRPEQPEDEPFRFALFCESRPDLALLPPPMRDNIQQMQFRAQTAGYRAQFPQARWEIVECAGESIGRLVCDRSQGFLHLVDIALLARTRNGGAGSAILRTLTDEAAAAGIAMRLRVGHTNPAANLYHRLGFAVTATDVTDATMEWRAG